MQVLEQEFPLEDINGNTNITLEAGDWHDNPQNLIFPGKTDTCNITYIHVNNTISPKRLTFYYTSSLSIFFKVFTSVAMRINVKLMCKGALDLFRTE